MVLTALLLVALFVNAQGKRIVDKKFSLPTKKGSVLSYKGDLRDGVSIFSLDDPDILSVTCAQGLGEVKVTLQPRKVMTFKAGDVITTYKWCRNEIDHETLTYRKVDKVTVKVPLITLETSLIPLRDIFSKLQLSYARNVTQDVPFQTVGGAAPSCSSQKGQEKAGCDQIIWNEDLVPVYSTDIKSQLACYNCTMKYNYLFVSGHIQYNDGEILNDSNFHIKFSATFSGKISVKNEEDTINSIVNTRIVDRIRLPVVVPVGPVPVLLNISVPIIIGVTSKTQEAFESTAKFDFKANGWVDLTKADGDWNAETKIDPVSEAHVDSLKSGTVQSFFGSGLHLKIPDVISINTGVVPVALNHKKEEEKCSTVQQSVEVPVTVILHKEGGVEGKDWPTFGIAFPEEGTPCGGDEENKDAEGSGDAGNAEKRLMKVSELFVKEEAVGDEAYKIINGAKVETNMREMQEQQFFMLGGLLGLVGLVALLVPLLQNLFKPAAPAPAPAAAAPCANPPCPDINARKSGCGILGIGCFFRNLGNRILGRAPAAAPVAPAAPVVMRKFNVQEEGEVNIESKLKNPVMCTQPCQNGVCMLDRCVCHVGFKGELCELVAEVQEPKCTDSCHEVTEDDVSFCRHLIGKTVCVRETDIKILDSKAFNRTNAVLGATKNEICMFKLLKMNCDLLFPECGEDKSVKSQCIETCVRDHLDCHKFLPTKMIATSKCVANSLGQSPIASCPMAKGSSPGRCIDVEASDRYCEHIPAKGKVMLFNIWKSIAEVNDVIKLKLKEFNETKSGPWAAAKLPPPCLKFQKFALCSSLLPLCSSLGEMLPLCREKCMSEGAKCTSNNPKSLADFCNSISHAKAGAKPIQLCSMGNKAVQEEGIDIFDFSVPHYMSPHPHRLEFKSSFVMITATIAIVAVVVMAAVKIHYRRRQASFNAQDTELLFVESA